MDDYTPEERAAYEEDPVSFCIKELKSADENIRFNAVDILRGMGKDGDPAVEPLLDVLLNDPVDTIRAQAAFAMIDLGYSCHNRVTELAIGPLTQALLSDPFEETRTLAASALGVIGPPAQSAIPALLQMSDSAEDEELKEAIDEALRSIRS